MRPAPETPPAVWRWLGRLVIALVVDASRRDEVHADLVDLWRHRHETGRRDLRRAWVRDLRGLVAAGGVRARPHGVASRSGGLRFRQGGIGMWQDVRYALRLMRRRPVTTIAAVLTLAIGIGAGVAILTALDRLLLKPLPYPDADRLVAVEHGPVAFGSSRLVARSFRDLPVIQAAGGYGSGGANLESTDDSRRVAVGVADRGFFETLGVPPLAGQWPPEVQDPVRTAVLAHDLWRARFGGDPGVVGRTITLNGQPYTVTGVMPPGFAFPGRTEVWIPPSVDFQATGNAFAPTIIARLAPGVSLEQARQAVAAQSAAQARERGVTDDDPTSIAPLTGALTASVRPTLFLLSASVALLLLVVCASVANLLLARIASRGREYALRRALGGTRWRIARQVLVESLLLSLGGAALGTIVAAWGLDGLAVLAPDVLGDLGLHAVDPRLLMLAALVSTGAALVFGAAPGLAAAGGRAERVARLERAETSPRVWRRLRAGLVVGQMAMVLVLLTLGAATLGALLQAARVDLGFGRTRALAMTVTLPIARFDEPPRFVTFFERARDRLLAAPTVERVAATGFLPGSRETGVGLSFTRPGRPDSPESDRFYATYLSASPDYFAVMGIPILSGRAFTPDDRRGAPEVAVISETAARGLFADGASPVGGQILPGLPGGRQGRPLQVIGVVADVRLHGADPGLPERSLRQVYVSLLQSPPFGSLSFVAEVAGDPAAATATLREAMRDVDATVPIYDVHTIASVADRYLAPARLAAWLVSGFALVTLVVSALGLYGVMAQLVSQRTREIGIRIALGAAPGAVRRRVVLHGVGLAVMGAAIGAAGAFGALRGFAAFVPTLGTIDGWMLAANAIVLVSVAGAAAWLPAARAARIDPMDALR